MRSIAAGSTCGPLCLHRRTILPSPMAPSAIPSTGTTQMALKMPVLGGIATASGPYSAAYSARI